MLSMNRRMLLGALGTSLLVGPVQAQGTVATPARMTGRVFVNERGGVRLHTYIAPPQGALVTSHIVETPNALILVDGQFTPAAATELNGYLASLGKPVARTILSHAHPDHWFGFHHLGARPVHAGPATARFLRENGAALIAERRVESSVPQLGGILSESAEIVAGIEMRFRLVLDTEAPEITVIEIPAANAVIVQDLVYNRVHAVVSRQITRWVEVLRGLERAGPTLILSGHGEPATPADLPGMVRYLEAAKSLMDGSSRRDGEIDRMVAEMTSAFPDYRLPPLLRLGLTRALGT